MPETIRVLPWADPVIDTLGHDPRSLYAETFWLPSLGPTCLLLLRHLAGRLETNPDGTEVRVADTSMALGLGPREGNSSPLMRSVLRLVQFDLACHKDDGAIGVRRNVPPVSRRHVRRLPEALQLEHASYVQARLAEPPGTTVRSKAYRIAYTLIELGEDQPSVERVLFRSGFHPSICRDATVWAVARRDCAETIGVPSADEMAASERTVTATPVPDPAPSAA
jgi:hypothetical protein